MTNDTGIHSNVMRYRNTNTKYGKNIILKATAKNPKNRYEDAKSMHDDLLTALILSFMFVVIFCETDRIL